MRDDSTIQFGPPPLRPSPRQPQVNSGVFSTLVTTLHGIERRLLQNRPIHLATLEDLGDFLQSIPCTTAEYGRATNNLRNALDYFGQGETGAARYELLLLLRHLRWLVQEV